MQKTAEISIPELIKTAGENLAVMREMFEAQKIEAESKGHDGTARVFRDLIVCVEQLQLIHFAMSMVESPDAANLTKPGKYAADLGNGFTGQFVDSLISQIQPGDTVQSFAARVLTDKVETAHSFSIDGLAHPVDFDGAINAIIDAGENPHRQLTPAVMTASGEAEKIEAATRLKTTEDFRHDARAFISAAMGYQHAVNVIATTPALLDRLKGYAQP